MLPLPAPRETFYAVTISVRSRQAIRQRGGNGAAVLPAFVRPYAILPMTTWGAINGATPLRQQRHTRLAMPATVVRQRRSKVEPGCRHTSRVACCQGYKAGLQWETNSLTTD